VVKIREIEERDISQCIKIVPQIEPWVTLGATPEKMDAYFRKLLNRIMQFIEDYAFARYPNVFLCVSSFNNEAQEFYQGLGYQKVGEFPNLIMEGQSEYLLRKTVGPVSL